MLSFLGSVETGQWLDIDSTMRYAWRLFVRNMMQNVQNVYPRRHMDRLSGLLGRFRIAAAVRYSGDLYEPLAVSVRQRISQLFVLRTGILSVLDARGQVIRRPGPGLLFLPRGEADTVIPDDLTPRVEVVCAEIDMGGSANPLVLALPSAVEVPLGHDAFDGLVELLLEEGLAQRCGRRTVLDRLAEILLVKLLRFLMEKEVARVGLLAGLSHPGLARPLTAMHERPADVWTVEALAYEAGMSRTAFANTFRQVVGVTPGAYLTGWRLMLAREMLSKGASVKTVATTVGYASPAALSRAISRQFGGSPRTLLADALRSPGP